MNEAQLLHAIYDIVRFHGTHLKPTPGRLGGIWGGDTYDIPDLARVMLVDDGYTRTVMAGGKTAWQTSDHPVEYRGGDALWLEALLEQTLTYVENK